MMAVVLVAMTACEKPLLSDYEDGKSASGNVILTFSATTGDIVTRGTTTGDDTLSRNNQDTTPGITRATTGDLSAYFTKLNVMVFDDDGNKAFSTVKTQQATDDDFGRMNVSLQEGTYTVVAVGHSSVKSATIKSPQMVQFTASDGEKLTDTFCYKGEFTIDEEPETFDMAMYRVGAMVRFCLTDETIPDGFARLKIDYTGGSANFNPTTSEGTTKSTQSENRQRRENKTYEVYTFPYLAVSGTLKMTLSALSADGTVIQQRTFDQVPVSRNRITTYTGKFFEEGAGNITQNGFTFTVNGEWEGEDKHNF